LYLPVIKLAHIDKTA